MSDMSDNIFKGLSPADILERPVYRGQLLIDGVWCDAADGATMERRSPAHDKVVATYALSAMQPITGSALLTNARVQLAQTGDKRSAALKERGLGVLSAIGAATHEELIGMIADARQELRLAQLIDAETEPGPEPDGRRIFVPMVTR